MLHPDAAIVFDKKAESALNLIGKNKGKVSRKTVAVHYIKALTFSQFNELLLILIGIFKRLELVDLIKNLLTSFVEPLLLVFFLPNTVNN